MLVDGKIKADSWSSVISDQTKEKDFLLLNLGGPINSLVHNGNYRSYYTPASEILGRQFVFSVYFENGILTSVALTPASDAASWESKELQLAKAKNDNWLMNHFGIKSPAIFLWGTVESVLDQRGGSSSIVIRYQHP
jgi:hypothetical protein